jgi:NADH:ubiquinone oxidoreductase subunit F (NADH-binding)
MSISGPNIRWRSSDCALPSPARERGYLGKQTLRQQLLVFDIKIKLGAGAFVCGEETALIASIEGERGMPRAKPPFPANRGCGASRRSSTTSRPWPTIPPIINRGAEWFASIGSERSKGTKVIALTGKIRNTGSDRNPDGHAAEDHHL